MVPGLKRQNNLKKFLYEALTEAVGLLSFSPFSNS